MTTKLWINGHEQYILGRPHSCNSRFGLVTMNNIEPQYVADLLILMKEFVKRLEDHLLIVATDEQLEKLKKIVDFEIDYRKNKRYTQ
jgi:hypothetical protein